MSDSDSPQDTPEFLIDMPAAVEYYRTYWGDPISSLPPLDRDEMWQRLRARSWSVTLPEKILTADGYAFLNGRIQNLRNELVEMLELVDMHYSFRMRAIKSLERVLVKFSDGRTDKLKDADVEEWLTPQRRNFESVGLLHSTITSKIANLDVCGNQVSRQQRAADFGRWTNSISIDMMNELPPGIRGGYDGGETEVMKNSGYRDE